MPVDSVTATGHAGAVQRTPKQVMDGEVFMSLLVAQLRNQDPSSPMDTNQMIAQTTQLAMMERLTELAVTSSDSFALEVRTAAAALIGREVSYAGQAGETVTGLVSAVSFAGDIPIVTVDGVAVALDRIAGISGT